MTATFSLLSPFADEAEILLCSIACAENAAVVIIEERKNKHVKNRRWIRLKYIETSNVNLILGIKANNTVRYHKIVCNVLCDLHYVTCIQRHTETCVVVNIGPVILITLAGS